MNRQCYVFNIGFNRSGSTSLTAALNMLGIPTVHYTIDGSGWSPLMSDTNKLEFFIKQNQIKNSKKRLFHGLDKQFKGFSDFTGQEYYRILYSQYPNSKFILTLRPFEDWIKSVIVMEKQQKRLDYNTNDGEQARVQVLVNSYFTFKEEIRDFFKDKTNSYLEIDICGGDGWIKLCKFLEREIPNVPFPYLGKSSTKKKNK